MREQIKAIMARVFGLPEVGDGISTATCDRWDSLRHLNLTIELEMELGLEFEPEEIAAMKSLDQIEEIISRKQK